MLRKPNALVVTRFVSGGPLVLKIAMTRLEPEGTRRERDRLSKARHRGLESESEVLQRKEQNKASMAKKRVLEPESEALLRKEHDRAC